MFELIKTIILGIVEGITEWLPISSTGHMILVEQFLRLNVSDEFMEMFRVVIQLGAILAVVVLYFEKLNPFYGRKSPKRKRETFDLWGKVIVGCIPAGVLGILFDDWMDAHLMNPYVVAFTLVFYGVIFIVLEHYNKRREFNVTTTTALTYRTAFYIGCFQCLSLVPGTSRSGATILGAMLLGVSRGVAAEYSFFLAAPVMAGASLIKGLKFVLSGVAISGLEISILVVGCVTAFIVSMAAIRFLVDYVRRHDFTVFGYYRIVLGILVAIYFLLA